MTIILTDSAAYLSRAEAAALNAQVVQMSYSVEDSIPYTEGYVDENGAYERLIAQNIMKMRTSQVSLGSLMSIFDDLLLAGHDVLCITLSSRLSGTYANARLAAREFDAGRIEIVDSLAAGAGIYILVREARTLLDRGGALKEVAARLRAMRPKIKTFFSVDDLTALRRSGRLGTVRMSVSTILNIKPLLRCQDGGIISTGIVRGKQEQNRALKNAIGAYRGEVMVQSFLADQQAQRLAEELRAMGNQATVRKVGPVLGIHLGCGAIGVAWREA